MNGSSGFQGLSPKAHFIITTNLPLLRFRVIFSFHKQFRASLSRYSLPTSTMAEQTEKAFLKQPNVFLRCIHWQEMSIYWDSFD